MKINKNFIYYSFLVFVLLVDSAVLCIIKENYIIFFLYFIFNCLFIYLFCAKKNVEECTIITIIILLFFSYFTDLYIHYFGLKVILEAEFIYLIPLLITCIKIKNKNAKLFTIYSVIYLLVNFILLIINHKVKLINYFTFIINILTFICFYYVFANLKCSKKMIDLYKFIFIISFCLTIIQTVVGFNVDTRNGVFSVFGWGAYTFFIMLFFIYNLILFLNKEKKFSNLIIAIILCSILYICTESKAALVIMFINFALITIFTKGVSMKKLIIMILAIIMIPLAYQLLLKYNPKFYYLNNFNTILRYYLGNNNPRYEYGRFVALYNVFKDLDSSTKLFGIGFGASTPLYNVFYTELNRNISYPYYIECYGYYYGFQHTSSATLLLDGGILLFVCVVCFIIKKLISCIVTIRKNPKQISGFLKFGIIIYLLYYFTYANVLKDFRMMAIIAIILGLNNLSRFFDNKENN